MQPPTPGSPTDWRAKLGQVVVEVRADAGIAGIGVGGGLWRASLDTRSFMPLAEVDPFGGVIVTDWYANPQMASERFKLTVYILDTRLRAHALRHRSRLGLLLAPVSFSPSSFCSR